ncbi:unnamed protein product [Trichogramma brassicae]|uniref:Uncharacterized protein n=1 Tax=Trichogramma brassicae TaxID=86971 RepID=A0A6H5IV32_9HYME|nr:unnamed protein product [Trichogramma brassicae]
MVEYALDAPLPLWASIGIDVALLHRDLHLSCNLLSPRLRRCLTWMRWSMLSRLEWWLLWILSLPYLRRAKRTNKKRVPRPMPAKTSS